MDTNNTDIILNPLEIPRYMKHRKKIKIGFVQINNSFSGHSYLPYSVGLLQSYIKKYASNPNIFEFLDSIYCRTNVFDAVNHFKNADIVGFSVYVWNFQLSLAIAKNSKKLIRI